MLEPQLYHNVTLRWKIALQEITKQNKTKTELKKLFSFFILPQGNGIFKHIVVWN